MIVQILLHLAMTFFPLGYLHPMLCIHVYITACTYATERIVVSIHLPDFLLGSVVMMMYILVQLAGLWEQGVAQ